MADVTVTLQQWQRRFPGGKVPEDRARAVIRQLFEALHRVHYTSPCHRDIVPATVEVTTREDGTESFAVPEFARKAEHHGEPGARRYLAPEQWWGARQNTATDQYALAVLFVELVTGSTPFADVFATEDETVMRTAVCNRPPHLPADCPRRDVLLRALSKDPRGRYPSCSAFVAALEGVVAEETAAAGEAAHHHHHHHHHHANDASDVIRLSARPKKRKIPWGLVLLLAALGAGVGMWGAREGWWDRVWARLSRDGEAAQAKRADALRKLRAQEVENAAREREAQLARIRAEREHQEQVSKQALADYRKFLEEGGTAVLTVRRDTLDQVRRKAQEDLAAQETTAAAARRLAQALQALKASTMPYSGVAKDIPPEHEVASAYRTLTEESSKLEALSGQFTEKHPSVVAQRKLAQAALARFREAVVQGAGQAQAADAAQSAALTAARAKAQEATRAYEDVAGAYEVAKLREEELERARQHAADRLADLRRREFDVQFGGGATTNRVGSW